MSEQRPNDTWSFLYLSSLRVSNGWAYDDDDDDDDDDDEVDEGDETDETDETDEADEVDEANEANECDGLMVFCCLQCLSDHRSDDLTDTWAEKFSSSSWTEEGRWVDYCWLTE